MSLIDEALSANATIANGYDPGAEAAGAKIGRWSPVRLPLADIEQMLGLAHADVDMIRNFGTVVSMTTRSNSWFCRPEGCGAPGRS